MVCWSNTLTFSLVSGDKCLMCGRTSRFVGVVFSGYVGSKSFLEHLKKLVTELKETNKNIKFGG